MAITGIILHVESEQLETVRAAMDAESDLTVFGDHEGQYLVIVGELPSGSMEDRMKELEEFPGVLATYTTYVNIEDEHMSAPGENLQTSVR